MTDATADLLWDTTEKPRAPKADWPLMGDIVSARAGIPDHLIHWQRAKGEDDPSPTG